MDFIAIDFETANRRSDSACQLGAVVVRDGQIAARHCWLIRPRPFYFDAGNIRIHGIQPQQVAEELEFDERWDEIWSVLEGHCLVAHNAPFDIGVLRACLGTHEIPVPELEFTCTRLIARQTWPEWRGFGLAAIAERLRLTFQHHDALEDAVACAQVLLTAAQRSQANDLQALDRRLGLQRGRCGPSGYQGARSRLISASRPSFASPRRKRTRRYARAGYAAAGVPADAASHTYGTGRVAEANAGSPPRLDLQRLRGQAGSLRTWQGKHVVFTGVLEQMQRYQAEDLAQCLGAQCQTGVTGKTDIVVIGGPDQRTVAAGRTQSVKEEQARSRVEQGQAIEFLSEDEFLRILTAE